MDGFIHVLQADSSHSDGDLVRDALKVEGGRFRVTQASSRSEFESRVVENGYEIVLSEFDVFGYGELGVMETVHRKDPDVLVMILTGRGSEEIAVKALESGAADYDVKSPGGMQQLPSTIRSVLASVRTNQGPSRESFPVCVVLAHDNITERKLVEEALSEAKLQLELAFQAAGISCWDWERTTGRVYFSPAWKRQLGYNEEEVESCCVTPTDTETTQAREQDSGQSGEEKLFDGLFDDATVNELVKEYARMLAAKAGAIEQAFRAQNIGRLAGLAHELKGVAGMYGFSDVSHKALSLGRG